MTGTNWQFLVSANVELQDQAVLHAFISEALERHEGGSGIITNQVRGLDKLVEQGFNHDEIRALRFHFHAMCILKYEDYNPKTEEIRFAIEEKWINGQLIDFNLTTEEACQLEMTQLTGQGSSMDLVWGLLYGMVLSIGMLLVLRMWSVNAMQRKGAWSGMVLSGLTYVLLVVWTVAGPSLSL